MKKTRSIMKAKYLALIVVSLIVLTLPYSYALVMQYLINPSGRVNTTGAGTATRFNNIHVVTWDTNNGFGSIPWNLFNSLSIFKMDPTPSGEIYYDGGDITGIQNCINTAHKNWAKCLLALGGQGLPISTINAILESTSVQNTLISNLLTEVTSKGYDGIESDFEADSSSSITFSSGQYTAFIRSLNTRLKAANPNYALTVCVADWMDADVDPSTLEPYVDVLMNMVYPTSGSLSSFQNIVNRDAARLANPKKMAIGLDFNPAEAGITAAGALPLMRWTIAQGYGLFFWNAEYLTSDWTSSIQTAITSTSGGGF